MNKDKEIKNIKSSNQFKNYINKINYKFKKNPNLKYKLNITETNSTYGSNDIFEVYISYKDNKEYVASKNSNYNLDIFLLLDNKKIKSLKGHKNDVMTIRYFINNKNMNEYLISGDDDKIVFIWDITDNYKIKYKIKTNYGKNNFIFSCLLMFPHFSNEDYIITSSSNYSSITTIYSLNNGSFIKDIPDSGDVMYLLPWYNKNNNKYYIIQFHRHFISINNLIENELYAKINEGNKWYEYGFIFNDKDNIDYLYSASETKNIIVWDLYKKIIFKKIEIKCNITYIIQWNYKYIIITDRSNNSFKVIDLENNIIISNIIASEKDLKCIKKIKHPIYGEVLLTAGDDGKIKLWCT
jgi:WD40 repeat protein